MSTFLLDALTTTDPLRTLFDDEHFVGAMVRFEVALAAVQARAGMIPPQAAAAIARAAAIESPYDMVAISREARASGTVALPFLRTFTARVSEVDAPSARFVHFGATSQDLVDSACVLALVGARRILEDDHARLGEALTALSHAHAGTIMTGRTLLQAAAPVTFGLKVAGWFGSVSRSWARLVQAFDAASLVQLGGATGTMAAFGAEGPRLAEWLADELELQNPGAPWHVHRDRLATLVAAAGVYTACLGKIARDISLLMQTEVAEVAEPGGSSSTMPHKRNPAHCAMILAAATRVPGLVSTYLSAVVQEHERAVGGWHAEWTTIADVIQTTGAALAASVDVVTHLSVFPDRMRENLARERGVIHAEHVMLQLSRTVGREEATRLVLEAVAASRASGRAFGDIVRATPALSAWMSAQDLQQFDQPEEYLGSAETLRLALLAT